MLNNSRLPLENIVRGEMSLSLRRRVVNQAEHDTPA